MRSRAQWREPMSGFDDNARLARAFTDAFNARDLDDFLAVLAEDVELRTPRGTRRGRVEAAQWFRKPFDHLDLRFEPEKLLVGDSEVIGVGELVFTWRETGEFAERLERAVVWTVENGLIRSWQPYESPADALRAAGMLPVAE
jgi:ketosteroid isomerase-like protein